MEHPPDARSPGVMGRGAGNEPQESEQRGESRMSSGGSEEPSPSVASGVAAPQMSTCPVEQRGFRYPRLRRRRDKASLAQIALRKKLGDAPKPAWKDGAILPLQAPTGGPSLTKDGATLGKTAKQGTEPKAPSRQAGGLGSPATASRCSSTFSTASVYLGGEKSQCSTPEVAFSR